MKAQRIKIKDLGKRTIKIKAMDPTNPNRDDIEFEIEATLTLEQVISGLANYKVIYASYGRAKDFVSYYEDEDVETLVNDALERLKLTVEYDYPSILFKLYKQYWGEDSYEPGYDTWTEYVEDNGNPWREFFGD